MTQAEIPIIHTDDDDGTEYMLQTTNQWGRPRDGPTRLIYSLGLSKYVMCVTKLALNVWMTELYALLHMTVVWIVCPAISSNLKSPDFVMRYHKVTQNACASIWNKVMEKFNYLKINSILF